MRSFFLIVCPFLVGTAAVRSTDAQDGPNLDMVRAIADMYDENRSTFSHGSFKFTFRIGSATSPEEAKVGKFASSHQANGSYAFDGPNAIYERVFALEDMRAATTALGGGSFSSTLESIRVLTNGKLTMTERITPGSQGDDLIYAHMITPGADDFYRSAKLPLGLGRAETARDDLAQNLRLVLDGDGPTRLAAVEPDVEYDGVKTVRITLAMKNGNRISWVDLERGAVPLRVKDEVRGAPSIDRFYDKITFVNGHGWIPLTETVFVEKGNSTRIELESVDFDSRPPADRFKMKLGRVSMVGNLEAGKAYRAQDTIDLNNLPSSSGPQTVNLGRSSTKVASQAQPGERSRPPRYFLYGSIVVILAVGAWAWRRRSA